MQRQTTRIATITFVLFTILAVAGPEPLPSLPHGASADSGTKGAESVLTPRLQELLDGGAGGGPLGIRPFARPTRDAVPAGPGSVLETPNGILVQVLADHVPPTLIGSIESTGARVVDVADDLGIVTVETTVGRLRDLEGLVGVRAVQEVLEPEVLQAEPGSTTIQPPCGSATSEGDDRLRARDLRVARGIEGEDVRVGILSDSWDNDDTDATSAGFDVAAGDLPGPENPCPGANRQVAVTPIEEVAGPPNRGRDEGRAMAQLVHDLAPAATLSFRSAFNGDADFAANIRQLADDDGADVIVDDVAYLNEPVFQQGPIAVAAEAAVARGVSYFAAAGNQARSSDGTSVGSYESASFRPASCPASVQAAVPDRVMLCHDFDPGSATDTTYRVGLDRELDYGFGLHWAEPWFGVTTDLDLYVLDSSGSLVNDALNDNLETQQPFESVRGTATGASRDVVIARYAGTATPRIKMLHVGTDIASVEYSSSTGGDVYGPTITGHRGAPNVTTVGAVPQDDLSRAQPFTSQGPVTHYFGPVTGTTPAAPIATTVIDKPDVAAVDRVRTSFFSGPAPARFDGTSAAAPHAAAVAALLLSCDPTLTPAEVERALTGTAVPVSSATPRQVGAGLVNALAAGETACPPLDDAQSPSVSSIVLSPSAPSSAEALYVEATASDGASAIVSASFTVDDGVSRPMRPTDGSFGSSTEPVRGIIGALSEGAHDVCVRATDAASNVTDPPVCATIEVGAPEPSEDDTPPTLTDIGFSPASPTPFLPLEVSVTATDDSSPMSSASIMLPGGSRLPLRPDDDAFGDLSEVVTTTLDPLPAGEHELCVTALDGAGNRSAPLCGAVTVAAPILDLAGPDDARPVIARFVASPPTGVAPLTVTFASTGSSGGGGYLWDFGDGKTSTQPRPTHTYTEDGEYTVTLRLTGPGGSDVETKVDAVRVSVDAASFTVDSDGDGIANGIESLVGADVSDPDDNRGSVAPQCPRSAVPAGRFGDVDGVHTAAVDCAAWYRWIEGTGGSRFRPLRTATRGQISSILARVLDDLSVEPDTLEGETPSFDDIADSVHAAAIRRLAGIGVVQGFDDGTFRPDVALDRAQTASIIHRFGAAIGAPVEPGPDAFDDDDDSVHEGAIDALAAAGVLRGVGARTFLPQAPVARQQLASIVVRFTGPLVVLAGLRPPP